MEKFIKRDLSTLTPEMKKDYGMVAAIIADNIFKGLYDKQGQGYIQAADTIADWAMEFIKKHENTNWEDVLFNISLKPLSKEMAANEMICWDDAVIDFAHYKLETLNK